MRRFFFIIGLFMVVMLSACRTARQVVQQVSTDSTSTVITSSWEKYKVESDSIRLNFTPIISYRTGTWTVVYKQLSQKVESKRAKVEVKMDSTGRVQIAATCKELEDSILVLHKTIKTYQSKVTQYEVKESRFKSFIDDIKKYVKFAIATIAVIAIAWVIVKIGNPLKFIKSLFK